MSGRSYYIDDNGTEHQIKKIFYTNSEGQPTQIKKDFYEDKNTFSSAHIVTFIIDTGNQQQLEIDDGADVITNAPIATKSGWVFTGWREDSAASSSVVPYMPCNSDNIVMYAVFRRTLTAYFSGNGATSGAVANQTGTQYYNNGNYANPSITMPANGYAKADASADAYDYHYAFAYWFIPNVGSWNPGASVPISANTTFYVYWSAVPFRYWAVRSNAPVTISPAGGWESPSLAAWPGKTYNWYVTLNDGHVFSGFGSASWGGAWAALDNELGVPGSAAAYPYQWSGALPAGYPYARISRQQYTTGYITINWFYVDL